MRIGLSAAVALERETYFSNGAKGGRSTTDCRSGLNHHQTCTLQLRKIVPQLPDHGSDQGRAGAVIGAVHTGSATCLALQAWLDAAPIREGRLFRAVDRHGNVRIGLSDQAVALIVKRRTSRIGLDSAVFSGHSLGAGLATTAANAVKERLIQHWTRHRSFTLLRTCIRDGNAAGQVGV
jgi:hypothetical protein